MTQPPDDAGGQPAADPSLGNQEGGPPAPPPPPDSWHFPPEPVPPPVPQVQQPYQAPPPPYGTSPQYGTPYGAPNAAQQQYGTAPPYGMQQPYGTPYGTTPQYGAPQPYSSPYGPAYPSYGTGQPAGPEPDLAEWWRRLLGRIIDGLVLSVVLIPIAIPLLYRAFHRLVQVSDRYPNPNAPGAQSALASADGKLLGAWFMFIVISAVIVFAYDSLQHAKWGQTLGKRAMSTRVVSAYDRSPITGAAAAKRAAVYALVPVIPLIGSFFALLNELWLLWDRRRQCLHDKAAHTIVIKTNVQGAGTWPPQRPPW